ncbi:MAG: hypothetical protein ACOYNY_05570 [Caldilineaceae bacterium]
MRVRYRILQEITPEGTWETIGAITDWESDPPHLRLRGIVQHTVSTAIWRKILTRVDECRLTLENYHEAFGDYERYYRLFPEIHCIEGESAAEIRHSLREKYVYGPLTEAVAA